MAESDEFRQIVRISLWELEIGCWELGMRVQQIRPTAQHN